MARPLLFPVHIILLWHGMEMDNLRLRNILMCTVFATLMAYIHTNDMHMCLIMCKKDLNTFEKLHLLCWNGKITQVWQSHNVGH